MSGIIDVFEVISEMVLLVWLIASVHTGAPMRYVFEAGVLYLAMVIRHSKDGGGE